MTETRAWVREAGAVFGASLLGGVAFTWPLVLHLQTRARNMQDVLFQAWTLDWVQYAVTHGRSVYDANIFAPQHTTLAFSDTLIGIAIPTLPLRWLGLTPLGVWNVSLILGFAASAAAGYLFVRLVTGSRVAATVGGAIYAFGPFGALASRHLHVAVRPGVPLAAAAAWWLAERARDRRGLAAPAITLVAIVGWQGTVSFYPAVYALTAAGLVMVFRLRDRRGLLAAGLALAGCSAVLAVLAIPNLEVAARDPSYRFTLDSFGPLGANFLRIEPGTSLWGPLLDVRASDTIRSGVFPGATALLVALWGLRCSWRRRGGTRTIAITSVALVVVGAVLAIGTAAAGLRSFAPYRLLFELGPPFSALRATSRAWMIGLCGLAVLGGLGAVEIVGWLQQRWGRSRPRRGVMLTVGTLVLIVVLVLAEGYDPYSDEPDVRISAVDVELARRDDPGGVVYLPMNETDTIDVSFFSQPMNLYGATAHHRAMPNGYSGFAPRSYLENSERLAGLPDARSLALLRSLDIRYVVVRPEVVGGRWATLRFPEQAEPLRFLGRFGNNLLYEWGPFPRAQE